MEKEEPWKLEFLRKRDRIEKGNLDALRESYEEELSDIKKRHRGGQDFIYEILANWQTAENKLGRYYRKYGELKK